MNARVRAVAAGTSNGYFYDRQLQGQDTRVYTMYSDRFLPVAIQVVAQLSTIDNELARIRLWLLLVSVGGIALASGAGLLVARTTLRPVRELSETAERVRKTRDLSQRIDVDGTDELATLARTFNAMLESLDEAAQRQRQLVQDASHELRTPLTSLRTNIEVLASGGRMPAAERKQLLQDVVVQLGEMTELIGELTELARGEEQNEPLEEVRLDLLDRGGDPPGDAAPPRRPDRGRPRADDRGRAARRASSARSRTCSTTRPSGAPPGRRSRCTSPTAS